MSATNDSNAGDDPVDDLLAACLAVPPASRPVALQDLCARHPEHADALRRRHTFLVESGLVDGPGALAAALPDRIGGFRILRLLGQGGMGVVYLAEQESMGRRVALKLIQPGAMAPPRARERFRRELLAAAQLDHPNICPLYDAGEVEGVPYLAMRYIEGEALADRIARECAARGGSTPVANTRSIDAWIELGESLARALHAAHEHGLVHRDVKPGNVMIEAGTGRPLLLDFGLAHLDDPETPTLTRSGDRIGTPAYMAPEQVAGGPVDRRTDVYGLGATLFEALTSHVPHQAPTLEALYRRILTADVSLARRHNPLVSKDLEVVLATALAREPDRRYRTAAEFADDLQRVRDRQPILARAPGPWLRARRWCQRNPYAASTIGVFGAGLLVFAIMFARLEQALTQKEGALRQKDAALSTVEAMAIRTTNPSAALRAAYDAASIESPPSPQAIAAVQAALHGCHVDVEVPIPGEHEHAFDISPDGSVIVWGDHQKRIWCWRHGDTDPRLLGALDSTFLGQMMRLSPDCRRLAIAGDDSPSIVFDLATGTRIELPHPLPVGRDERALSVAWHPRQNLLAVGTGDYDWENTKSRVHLWDLDAPGDGPRWSVPVGGWPWHLAFADAETLVAAVGCMLWDSHSGFVNHNVNAFWLDGTQRGSHAVHSRPCMDLAIAGSLVATVGHDRQLVLWDCHAGTPPIVCPHDGRIHSVAFSPDGEVIVTGGEDGRVRQYDRRGGLLSAWPAHGDMGVWSVGFDPSGERLLLRVRDRRWVATRDGRPLFEMPSTRFVVRNERFLSDGRMVTFDRDTITIRRLDVGLAGHSLPAGRKPVLAADGSRFLSVGKDGACELFDWPHSRRWQAVLPLQGAPSISNWICVDDEGRAFAATHERRLAIVSPIGELERAVAKPGADPESEEVWQRVIWYLSPSPGGGMVAGSAAGHNLRIVARDPEGRWSTCAWIVPTRGDKRGLQPRMPFAWAKDPEGAWRILAGTARGVMQFRLTDGKLTQLAEHLLPDSRIDQMALSPDQRTLAVDLAEGGLRIFVRDGDGWRQRASLPSSTLVVHLAFARDDRLLATSAERVRILDLDGNLVGLLANIDATGFVSAHRLPGNERVLTISANQIMREWWLDGDRALEHARRLLRQ